MPDPNAIALATVDRLTPLTLQLARSSLQSVLRNGNVVEARVVGMLAKDVAQLGILGQKVEVSTPQALKAGTTISVAINRTPAAFNSSFNPMHMALARHRARSPRPCSGGPTPRRVKQPAVCGLQRPRSKSGFSRRRPRSTKRY